MGEPKFHPANQGHGTTLLQESPETTLPEVSRTESAVTKVSCSEDAKKHNDRTWAADP